MSKLGFTKLWPIIIMVLPFALGACSLFEGSITVAEEQDISNGFITVREGDEMDTNGRIDVRRTNEDGSVGDVIGSAPVGKNFGFVLVELDLTRATYELHIVLINDEGTPIDEENVGVEGIEEGLATSQTTSSPTSVPDSPTSTLIPTSTPVPEAVEPEADLAYTGPVEYADDINDCFDSNREPHDCPLGIDMALVMVGVARNDTEWADWLNEAGAWGFVIGEIPYTVPMFILSIRFNDGFDPEVGNYCVVFASPQKDFSSSATGADVVQMCTFPDSFSFTTKINTDGVRSDDFEPPGAFGDSDLETTVTLFHPLSGIFKEMPVKPLFIFSITNDATVRDTLSVENPLQFVPPF